VRSRGGARARARAPPPPARRRRRERALALKRLHVTRMTRRYEVFFS